MIGSYKKIKVLHEGKVVKVWLVEDSKTGKECVAKFISLKVMTEKLMKEEIEAHKKVDDPHLVKTIDAFKDTASDCFIIVTEHCPGGSLDSLITGSLISEATVRTFLEGAAKGLFALHNAKIIHRDICPQHILVGADGKVKIMLFGLSRFIKQCKSHPFKERLSASYDAPEVFDGTGFRKAADMWSLGCTIYELCTLNQAFSGETRQDVIKKIRDAKYEPLPISSKLYSKELIAIVESIMQKGVEVRRTARDIVKNDYFNHEFKPSLIMQKSCEWIEKALKAKNRKEAHECYAKAVEIYKGIGEEDMILAKFYVKMGDTAEKDEEKLEYYQKSLELHKKFGSMTKTLAKIHYKLGINKKVGSEQEQIEHLQKAIEICDHLGFEDTTKAKASSHLGNLIQDKDLKKKYYNDALRIFENMKKEKEELANTYFNVSTMLDNDSEIEENSKKAIALYEKLKIKSIMRADAYRTAARQAKKVGNEDEASKFGKLAFESYKNLLYPENTKAEEVAKEFNLTV